MKDIPIVSAATGFTSENGRNYILVFHEALYNMSDMKHTLNNLNQCRHFRSKFTGQPLPWGLPDVNWESQRRIRRMLAVRWNRYVLRYLVSHAGLPKFISTYWVNAPPTLESTQNRVSTNKIVCVRIGRGAECLEGNNMIFWGYTRRYRSLTRWRYQRWI